MNASQTSLVIPAKTQIGAQLNKVTNTPKESSCQGEDFSSRLTKKTSVQNKQQNSPIYKMKTRC